MSQPCSTAGGGATDIDMYVVISLHQQAWPPDSMQCNIDLGVIKEYQLL
jgi:hypothetical protein